MSTAMVVPAKAEPLMFSPEQQQMIRDTYANGATEAEFQVFMEVARMRRLNPLTRQIHLVKRWNSELRREVATPQTGIDGLRSIAERTGQYDGQDEPEFEYEPDGKRLKLARVRVYKKGIARAFVGVAHFGEYAQIKKDGSLTSMWMHKPHIMLAKCAESIALRKAFPEDTGGLYTDEEMPQPEQREEPVKRAPKKATPPEGPPPDEHAPAAAQTVTVPPPNPQHATKNAPANGKLPIWQQAVVIATDYGFECGQGNAFLWAYVRDVIGKKPAAEWTENDLLKIEAALAEKMASRGETPPPPVDQQPPPENDIPF